MNICNPPHFAQAGGAAGTAVDLLFFPIDTVKTRLQSAQGFVRAGGFKGIYKGIGSVVVGSAPGGEHCRACRSTLYDRRAAAIFFSTYEMSKQSLPLHGQLAPLNHMISASIGEIVCRPVSLPCLRVSEVTCFRQPA